MFPTKEIPAAASSLFSAYASLAATTMLIRSMANDLIPHPLRSYIYSLLRYLFTPLSSTVTLIIDEYSGFTPNQLYDAAELYLATKITASTERLRASKTRRQKNLTVTIDDGEVIPDRFDDVQLKWRLVRVNEPQGMQGPHQQHGREKRHFELTFRKEFKDKVLGSYLPYVVERANEMRNRERVLKLYSRHCPFHSEDHGAGGGGKGLWGSVDLEHPSTFETLAMDSLMKKAITEDLDRFVSRKEFYKRVGKAWKRGYLLYGPPGTGKSSLVAAMANYLKFDIYDLELTGIFSNDELRRVLLSTSNRSILVIEDIDCTVEMTDRALSEDQFDYKKFAKPPRPPKLTLSGLLNFIDGLWSCCGDERIIVFTTNHKDKLDPALLRPGRMDVHINMSYCSGEGFKLLASNYLGLHETCQNPLYEEVHGLIETAQATPAEVAEQLMKSDDANVALQGLAGFLKRKRTKESQMKNEGADDHRVHEAKKLKASDNVF